MINLSIEDVLPYAFVMVVVVPFLMLLRQFIEMKKKELALLSRHSNHQAKLQAYERMTIFLERLKPIHLVNKFDKNLNVKGFVFLLDKSIKEEFEYNTSQQLYLGDQSWRDILNAKNNILHLVHQLVKVNPSVSLEEFKTLLLVHYLEGEDYISDCIQNLKSDIQHLI